MQTIFKSTMALVLTAAIVAPLHAQPSSGSTSLEIEPVVVAPAPAQTEHVFFGSMAMLAWGSMGAINIVIADQLNFSPRSAAVGQVMNGLCGTAAAGITKRWNPSQAEKTWRNGVLAIVKSGIITGSANLCGWTSTVVFSRFEKDFNLAKANSTRPYEGGGNKQLVANMRFDAAEKATAVSFMKMVAAKRNYKSFKDQYNKMPGCAKNMKNPPVSLCSAAATNITTALRSYNATVLDLKRKAWDFGQTVWLEEEWAQIHLPQPRARRP